MKPSEQKRFERLYQSHLRALKLHGLSQRTTEAYARAVRRLANHFDCCPDQLTVEQLEVYFLSTPTQCYLSSMSGTDESHWVYPTCMAIWINQQTGKPFIHVAREKGICERYRLTTSL